MAMVAQWLCVLLQVVICSEVIRANVLLTSVKTAYNDSLTDADWEIINNYNYLFVPSTCEPILLNVILRHGTRYPKNRDVEKILALAEKIRGHVRNPNFTAVNEWVPGYHVGEKQLAGTGYAELQELGQRYGRRFSDFLSGEDSLRFITSSQERATGSCHSFRQGIRSVLREDINTNCNVRDDLVRFYQHCPYLDINVWRNKQVLTEYNAFGDGPEMTDLVNNVNKLLDLDDGLALSKEELDLMYMVLGYDLAIRGSSVLEGIMDEHQLEIMAYWNDMKYYWQRAYSDSINAEVACILLGDVFKRIDEAILANEAGHRFYKAVFEFGHTSTVMRLAALLYPNKGVHPLQHDTFSEDREFKTSRDSPFGANMAFTVYKCDTSRPIPASDRDKAPPGVTWPDQVSDVMIQLLYNEIPARFLSSPYHLAPLDDVIAAYGQDVFHCDKDTICREFYNGNLASP